VANIEVQRRGAVTLAADAVDDRFGPARVVRRIVRKR
jgi:hypothetical protein